MTNLTTKIEEVKEELANLFNKVDIYTKEEELKDICRQKEIDELYEEIEELDDHKDRLEAELEELEQAEWQEEQEYLEDVANEGRF